jgi:hypothetical protein
VDVGYLYLVQLAPDIAPSRVKMGWAGSAERRLRDHRTAAPTAQLLRAWPCPQRFEQRIIRLAAAGCLPLSRESFDCDSIEAVLQRIEAALVTVRDAPEPAPSPMSPPLPDDEYVTLQEAAALLNISRYAMTRLIKEEGLSVFELPSDKRAKLLRRTEVLALQRPRPKAD